MSQAKERPILFSGPMVRAILEGRKTVTRRPVKPQPEVRMVEGAIPMLTFKNKRGGHWLYPNARTQIIADCPYGRPGDRLWVRETFYAFGRWITRFSEKKGRDEWHFVDMTLECGHAYVYDADAPNLQLASDRGSMTPGWYKRPAIFMPRGASRILPDITDVRIERLQDISDDQAKAEGMVYTDFGMQERLGKVSLDGGKTFHPMKPQQAPGWHAGDATHPDHCLDRARWAFANLWEKINGEYSWDANPWVWAIEFKRVEP